MKYTGFIIVGVLALLAGCHTLDGEWVSDDFVLLEAAENVGVVRMFTANWLGERGTGGFYRPMVLATWKLDHLLHGRNPRGYHLTNLLLHLAVVLMAYLLIWSVTQTTWIALPAVSMFAVHPIHVEAIAWVSGRTDTVAAAFFLLSVLCFERSGHYEQSRGSAIRIVALISGICAMLSKEIAYTLPLVLFAVNMRIPQASLRRRQSSMPYFVALVVILLIRFRALGGLLGGYGAGKHLRFDGVIFNYIGFYLQWFIEPFSLPGQPSSAIWSVLIWSFLILSVTAMVSPVTRWGIIWFWITMIPVLNICRAQYVYLPSLGLFGCLAAVVFGNKRSDERDVMDFIRAGAWVSLVIVFSLHTWEKNRQWSYTGWVGKGIEQIFRAVQPDVSARNRIVVISSPVNAQINIGVFQNGIGEAVRLWYDEPSLEASRFLLSEHYVDRQPDRDIVWECVQGQFYLRSTPEQVLTENRTPWPGFDSSTVFPTTKSVELSAMNTSIAGIELLSQLSNADALADERAVAEIVIEFDDGRRELHNLQVGRHTSEWAFDRPDVRSRIRHQRAPVAYSYIGGVFPESPSVGHTYRGDIMFDAPGIPSRVTIRSLVDSIPGGHTAGNDTPDITLEIRGIQAILPITQTSSERQSGAS